MKFNVASIHLYLKPIKYAVIGAIGLSAGACAKYSPKNQQSQAFGQSYAQAPSSYRSPYGAAQVHNGGQYTYGQQNPFESLNAVEPNSFLQTAQSSYQNPAPNTGYYQGTTAPYTSQSPDPYPPQTYNAPAYNSQTYPKPGVSIYESAGRAYNSSRMIRAGQSHIAEANESYLQARAAGLPSIDLSGSYGVTANRAEPSIAGVANISSERQIGILKAGISQPLYDGGKIKSEKQIARTEITLAENDLRTTESEVLQDTMLAHVSILRDETVGYLYGQSVQNLQEQLRAAHLLLEHGEGTRADTALIEARLRSVEVSRDEALLKLENSISEYAYLTGTRPTSLSEPRLNAMPANLMEAQRLAQTFNPDVVGSQHERDIAGERLKIAKSEKKPKVSLRGSLSEITGESDLISNSSAATVSLNLNMPFSLGGKYKSQVKEASFALTRSEIESQQVLRDVTQRVGMLWQNIQTARRALSLRQDQVGANKMAVSTLKMQNDAGYATRTELLSAERDLLDAQISLVRAKHNASELEIGLLAAIGRLDARSTGLLGAGGLRGHGHNMASTAGSRSYSKPKNRGSGRRKSARYR